MKAEYYYYILFAVFTLINIKFFQYLNPCILECLRINSHLI